MCSEVGIMEEDVLEGLVRGEAAEVEGGEAVLPRPPLLLLVDVGVVEERAQEVEDGAGQRVPHHQPHPLAPEHHGYQEELQMKVCEYFTIKEKAHSRTCDCETSRTFH